MRHSRRPPVRARKRPRTAVSNHRETASIPVASSFSVAFDWSDPEEARRWLHLIRDATCDLALFVRDASQPRGYRYYSDERRLEEARATEQSILDLLVQAEARLPPRAGPLHGA
jgi:hypothetical protein